MWQALWFNLCPTQKGEGACLQFWLWSLKQLRCHSRLNPLMPTVAIWVHHAIKHPVADRVKQSFLILTSGHSDAQGWAVPMWQQWASKCWLWYWVCIYPSYSRTSYALAITPPPTYTTTCIIESLQCSLCVSDGRTNGNVDGSGHGHVRPVSTPSRHRQGILQYSTATLIHSFIGLWIFLLYCRTPCLN